MGDLLFKVCKDIVKFAEMCAPCLKCKKMTIFFNPCQVAGTSGKVVLEGGSDDEGASTEAQGRAIVDVLGKDRRNEVLAAVYMVRSDVSLTVRQVPCILSGFL